MKSKSLSGRKEMAWTEGKAEAHEKRGSSEQKKKGESQNTHRATLYNTKKVGEKKKDEIKIGARERKKNRPCARRLGLVVNKANRGKEGPQDAEVYKK